MSRKGINIPVAADTRAFAKGVDSGVVEPLEDVVEVLADIAREGDRAGEKLEDSMRDAQRATDKLADEHKDLQETISRGSRTAFRKMEDASDEATTRASRDAAEFKDEANQNFSEVASSFQGDMSSAVDLVQGTLGGLARSIPGYGLAIGALGAGFGALAAGAIANAEKTKQVVADMYDDLLDSGQKYLSESYKQEQYWAILKNESDIVKLDRVKQIAAEAGLSNEQVALAYAGDIALMEDVTGRLIEKRKELWGDGLEGWTEEDQAANEHIALLSLLIDKNAARLQQIDDTVSAVNRGQAAWNSYGSEAGRVQDEQNRKLGEAYDYLAKMPKTVTVTVNADVSALRKQVQGALSDAQFTAYVNARTNVGKAVY